jgi:hypothetical protein
VSQFRVVCLGNIFVCCVVLCTLALAADQKSPTKLSDLPAEAQQAISAALARKSPAIQDFTLTASDGVSHDEFGYSVAIDGNTVVVGAIDHNVLSGAAYVFVKPAKGWANMTQTAELTASDVQTGDVFGESVSVSGNTIVVGAPGATVNGNGAQGAAYVFVKPASGWANMTETAKLTASDGSSDAGFGAAAIAGGTVVVGAPGGTIQNPGPGAAYVFVKPNGGWSNMTQTAELTASDGTDYNDFGDSVSINGTTVIVGAAQGGGNQGPGAAYVFVEPQAGWINMTETAKLTASDGAVGDAFGFSVSLSGNIAAIGAFVKSDEKGAAYVFAEPAGGWGNMTETAELTIATGKPSDLFGYSVSVAGKAIVAGAPGFHAARGTAYVFLEPAGGWKTTSKYNFVLSETFKNGKDYLGNSVAVSGSTAVVGAWGAPSQCIGLKCVSGPGEAFVFTAK